MVEFEAFRRVDRRDRDTPLIERLHIADRRTFHRGDRLEHGLLPPGVSAHLVWQSLLFQCIHHNTLLAVEPCEHCEIPRPGALPHESGDARGDGLRLLRIGLVRRAQHTPRPFPHRLELEIVLALRGFAQYGVCPCDDGLCRAVIGVECDIRGERMELAREMVEIVACGAGKRVDRLRRVAHNAHIATLTEPAAHQPVLQR